ncbi:hypothetical protein [Actinoplanes sp. NPDC026623]|uniref:hypothetical protein n=1 Tax=Actinoplanes sp. NPDC026623 TaxID=3155610 RepID=UPI0034038AD3
MTDDITLGLDRATAENLYVTLHEIGNISRPVHGSPLRLLNKSSGSEAFCGYSPREMKIGCTPAAPSQWQEDHFLTPPELVWGGSTEGFRLGIGIRSVWVRVR